MLARWPLPRWRSARPHPHKGAGLEGHLAPEVFRTPIDCQAIFLLPLAVRRIRRCFRHERCLRVSGSRYRHDLVASSVVEQGPDGSRHLCGQCGSHLVAIREGQDEYILRVATLDADPSQRPVIHIWTSHDAPWLAGDNLPTVPKGLA